MKISIPKTLYEKIKARIEGTDFDSVSEYVTYVVRKVLANLEEDIDLTKEEEDKVKEKLKALGYID